MPTATTTPEAPQHHDASRSHVPSAALPFGQPIQLSSIGGSAYVTAQSSVQQVAYLLSDKVFSYSPDTFDLDVSLKQWHNQHEQNAWAGVTGVSLQQTRTGAGSLALGYIFSRDFDPQKRHRPQSIVASSAALKELRVSLDQLSLLYNVASPVVAHVAAVDYVAGPTPSLSANYVSSMTVADDLGLGLVASSSTFEAQHMALLATLMARFAPSIHTYDGVYVGRETARVTDSLSRDALYQTYRAISRDLADPLLKHANWQGQMLRLLQTFNEELGTEYKPFEYYGHAQANTAVVVFGSVEASLASQLAYTMAKHGSKVGVVNVRVYRPFLEEEFVKVLPKTVNNIVVLGQVADMESVEDPAEHSKLFEDVLAAVAFSPRLSSSTKVTDWKYGVSKVWTPKAMLSILQSSLLGKVGLQAETNGNSFDLLDLSVAQYAFWNTDDSNLTSVPVALAELLAASPTENVTVNTMYDNLVRGGTVRTDLRSSPQSLEAPYSVVAASLVFVGEEKLLQDVDVTNSLRDEGSIILRMPNSSSESLEKIEKRLPLEFRLGVVSKAAKLYIFDPTADKHVADNPQVESLLLQNTFLQLAYPETPAEPADSVAQDSSSPSSGSDDNVLRRIEPPLSWINTDVKEVPIAELPRNITQNSFVPFDKSEIEQPQELPSWHAIAKALAFKETSGTRTALRPDLGVKTYTIHVKEHKRLTPTTYDRNIFHIEFDLGDSGLVYNIGEALGIHAENDKTEVEEFISWYGLHSDDIVEVPAREDPSLLESRTVYQALLQNVDIFGRPPKRFYESLAEFAKDDAEQKSLLVLAGAEGATEFKRRAEVDTVTYADIFKEFPSARPDFHDIVRLVAPMKRREYSIASSQKVTPNSVSLLIVTVGWVDPSGRDRFGQATRYLNTLGVGAAVTVSVKPSVMKLPTSTTSPLIMAGLGTGLAPFRAFVQERAWQKQQGHPIGSVMLYMGSRHQREEYLYGEEWEAYQASGIITLLGRAFSRDQPQKVYIQDRMRQTLPEIQKAYLHDGGSFYLCGPTWPVPDVTEVLQEAVAADAKAAGKKIDSRREIENLKDAARYVLEVY